MLFDKDGFYMVNPKKDGYDFAVDIMTGETGKLKIYDLDDGFKRGNLFPKLYDPYMSYEPKSPKVDTEREKRLLEIQQLDFAITDLNLYLDLYPDDVAAYKTFKNYVNKCKKKKEDYTRMFGPLVLDELTDEYEWSKGVWPWEEGGM